MYKAFIVNVMDLINTAFSLSPIEIEQNKKIKKKYLTRNGKIKFKNRG